MVAAVIFRQSGGRVYQDVPVLIADEVRTYYGTEVFTYHGSYLYVEPWRFLQFEHVHAVHEFLYLVVVLREVQVYIPEPVFLLYDSGIKCYFDTVVLYLTGIDQPVVVPGCPGTGHAHDLVLAVLHIVGDVKSYAPVEELGLESGFERIGHRRFQVLVRQGTVVYVADSVPRIRELRFRVDQAELVRIRVASDLCP